MAGLWIHTNHKRLFSTTNHNNLPISFETMCSNKLNGAGPADAVKKFSDLMISTLFWKVRQCMLLKICRRFEGTKRIHLLLWILRQNITSKFRYTSKRTRTVTSHATAPFAVTAVMTWSLDCITACMHTYIYTYIYIRTYTVISRLTSDPANEFFG